MLSLLLGRNEGMFYEEFLPNLLAALTIIGWFWCPALFIIFFLALGLEGIKKSSVKAIGSLFVLACASGLICYFSANYSSQITQERRTFYASQRETYLNKKEKIIKVSRDMVTLTVVTPEGNTRKFKIDDDNVLIDEGINRVDDLTGMYLYSSTTKGAFITPVIRRE